MASGRKQACLSSMDEIRYRTEVLLLGQDETEEEWEERLVAEARDLGLGIPNIEIAADSGCLPMSPSVRSRTTRPSLAPSSMSDVVRSGGTSLDQRESSVSESTLSDRVPSSLPSFDSFSTRPTSFSSSDVLLAHANDQLSPATQSSASSAVTAPERKRTSFINAIGKSFRKRRTPSAVSFPSNTHITLRQKEGQLLDTVSIEKNALDSATGNDWEVEGTTEVEVPGYDEAALRRSSENPKLRELYERHKLERRRFIHLQNTFLESLKDKHLAIIAEKKLSNAQIEAERERQNAAHTARLEERQLFVEIDQIKEFEKAKRSSQTRIKYMEGYVNSSSPPHSPPTSISGSVSSLDVATPSRMVTRRQKEQLAQEYLDRDSMDRLHEARIKVLRERQECNLQDAIVRLQKEMEHLVGKNKELVVELGREHQRQEQAVLQAFAVKEVQLRRRWNLEEAILRKRLEDEDGLPYGPLPTLSFNDPDEVLSTPKNAFTDSRSSLLHE